MSKPFKGFLSAVAVPWAIERGVPQIQLTIVENGDTIAEFAAMHRERDVDALSSVVVRARFAAGQYVRFFAASTDATALPPDLYDASHLDVPAFDPQSPDAWGEAFNAQWKRTGLAPDPYFYEVRESAWAAEYPRHRLKHYVLNGHDAWCEVLCLSMSWEIVGRAIE